MKGCVINFSLVCLVLLSLQPSSAQEEKPRSVWYFRPTPESLCPENVIPEEQCFVLSEVLRNSTASEVIFTSNTILAFLSGDHVLDFSFKGFLTLRDVENVTFLGSPDRVPATGGIRGPASRIVCKSPFGMAFINISQLSLSNMSFSGCGTNITSELAIDAFSAQTHGVHSFGPEQKAALLLININTFQMIRCLVEESLGYGLLGINVVGDSAVIGSIFIANNNYTVQMSRCIKYPVIIPDDISSCSGGNALFVYEDLLECPSNEIQYSLLIRSSVFALGVNGFGGRLNDSFLTRGTGIGLILTQNSYGVTITLDTISSFSNSALVGSNIYIAIYDTVDNSSILIQNSNSIQANGGLLTVSNFFEQSQSASGGLHVDYGIPYPTTTKKPVCMSKTKFYQEDIITIINSNFSQNVALLGAGAYFEIRVGVGSAPDHFGSVVRFKLEDCKFINNVGITGTAIYFSQQNGLGVGNSELIMKGVTLTNNTYVVPIRDLTELYTTFQLNTVQLISTKNATIVGCTFIGNEGSALSAFGTNVIMLGQLMFESNSGVTGGAINLQDSQLTFYPHTQIAFKNNYALYRGGALNVIGRSDVALPCFFQVQDPNFMNNTNITLYFEGNFAEEAGSVLYGGSIDRCIVSAASSFSAYESGELFNNITDIGPHSPATSLISSDSKMVCACAYGVPNCTPRSVKVALFPGAILVFPVVTVGQRSGSTPSNVYIVTENGTEVSQFQKIQQVEKTCTNLNFTVRTNRSETKLVIRTNNLAVNGNFLVIIQVLPCPLGFVRNSSGVCACDPVAQSPNFNINCNIDSQTISREGGSWLNASFLGPNKTYDGILVLSNCPYDYCLGQATDVNLLEPDTQCDFNRTGILCGACRDGLSLTLATSRCTECSNNNLAILIGYLFAGFALVFILFLLDLTISAGTLNGLIFYANVINIYPALFFPPGAYNAVTVFIAWINLDTGVGICFYNGMNAYAKSWLSFTFPLYIWLLVAIIIVASRFSHRIARLSGSRPVSVLATLILLSYNKLLNAAIISLSSSSVARPDGSYNVVWSTDGNLEFLHGKHIVLGIFAIAVLLLFIIPYTLLLLIVPLPFVQARSTHKLLSWINTLKPFLDAHQGPFKQRFRNWIGMLLLIRAFLSIWASVNIGEYNNEAIILVSAIILMFLLLCVGWVSGGGMYNYWPHNLLESSFYLNLGITCLLSLYVQNADTRANQSQVILVSGWIALLEFIGILAFHLYKRIHSNKRFHELKSEIMMNIKRTRKPSQPLNEEMQVPLVPTENFTTSLFEFREPLLDD